MCVSSHGDNWQGRLLTAGLVEGVVVVLRGSPQFQLSRALTLIPAPHTDAHDAGPRGSPRGSATCCRVRAGMLMPERRAEAVSLR